MMFQDFAALADLADLELLDAELVGCVGADFGDNMVAAFQAQKPAPTEGGPLTAAYDAARSFFFPKPEAARPVAASPLPGALAAGTRDENSLTDLEFSARHPERGGQKIQPGEKDLAKEWTQIRDDVVRPALARTTPASSASPAPAAVALTVPSPAPAPPPPGSNAAVAAQVAQDTKRNQQIALGLGALALIGLGTALITR